MNNTKSKKGTNEDMGNGDGGDNKMQRPHEHCDLRE